MQAKIVQKNKYTFETDIRSHRVLMDIPKTQQGDDQGPTPKEFLLSSVIGCSAMDVVAMLGKYKIEYETMSVSVEANTTDTHPKVFTEMNVVYDIGAKPEKADEAFNAKVIESVKKSMTLYCGVSAMLAKACPIFYTIRVNEEIIARDQADFTRK